VTLGRVDAPRSGRRSLSARPPASRPGRRASARRAHPDDPPEAPGALRPRAAAGRSAARRSLARGLRHARALAKPERGRGERARAGGHRRHEWDPVRRDAAGDDRAAAGDDDPKARAAIHKRLVDAQVQLGEQEEMGEILRKQLIAATAKRETAELSLRQARAGAKHRELQEKYDELNALFATVERAWADAWQSRRRSASSRPVPTPVTCIGSKMHSPRAWGLAWCSVSPASATDGGADAQCYARCEKGCDAWEQYGRGR